MEKDLHKEILDLIKYDEEGNILSTSIEFCAQSVLMLLGEVESITDSHLKKLIVDILNILIFLVDEKQVIEDEQKFYAILKLGLKIGELGTYRSINQFRDRIIESQKEIKIAEKKLATIQGAMSSKNKENECIKAEVQDLAKKIWKDDTEKIMRVGDMVNLIQSILKKTKLPKKSASTLRKWLSKLATEEKLTYAMQSGNPTVERQQKVNKFKANYS